MDHLASIKSQSLNNATDRYTQVVTDSKETIKCVYVSYCT